MGKRKRNTYYDECFEEPQLCQVEKEIDNLPKEPLDLGKYADEVKIECKDLLNDYNCMICY